MIGAVTAEDREDANNMDTVSFTMAACEIGGQTYDGTGGAAGSGGSPDEPSDDGGCDCTVQGSKLDYSKIGFSLLLVGVLVGRRLRKRRF